MRKSILVLIAMFTFSTAMISCRDTEGDVDDVELENYDDNGMETTEDEFETTEDEFENTEDNLGEDEGVINDNNTTTTTGGI